MEKNKGKIILNKYKPSLPHLSDRFNNFQIQDPSLQARIIHPTYNNDTTEKKEIKKTERRVLGLGIKSEIRYRRTKGYKEETARQEVDVRANEKRSCLTRLKAWFK